MKALYFAGLVLRALGSLLYRLLKGLLVIAVLFTLMWYCIGWVYDRPAAQIAVLVLIVLAIIGGLLLIVICRCRELWDQDAGAREDYSLFTRPAERTECNHGTSYRYTCEECEAEYRASQPKPIQPDDKECPF